jgi:hypothetical protein
MKNKRWDYAWPLQNHEGPLNIGMLLWMFVAFCVVMILLGLLINLLPW